MSNDVENPKDGHATKAGHGLNVPPSSPALETTQSTWYGSLIQQASVHGVDAGYSISAPLLSITNKWAVMKFTYLAALTAL